MSYGGVGQKLLGLQYSVSGGSVPDGIASCIVYRSYGTSVEVDREVRLEVAIIVTAHHTSTTAPLATITEMTKG